MPASAGQVLDRQAYEGTGQGHDRQRPPDRLSVKTQRLWQIRGVKNPFLQITDEHQEPIRRRRDEHAQNADDDQKDKIVPGPKQGHNIGG